MPAEPDTESPDKKSVHTLKVLFLAIFLVCLFGGAFALIHLTTSPVFPDGGKVLLIERGMSVQEIADTAKEKGIVRSSLFLYALLTFKYDPTTIYAGTYSFTKPSSVFEVAHKLANDDIDKSLVSITIPEGSTRKDIAEIAKRKIPNFDTMRFLELTKNNEGYLFPDTYFVSTDFSADELVALLAETFAGKVASLNAEITKSSFTEYQILVLASILEREANDEESMRTVSGILQHRLEIRMPLQTDATMEYVLDKSLSELTADDLKMDTPYNTYKYPGLPPTPIGNPGMQAIRAVLDPIKSEYLYYITGTDGKFHYAKTFEEHKKNVQKHL